MKATKVMVNPRSTFKILTTEEYDSRDGHFFVTAKGFDHLYNKPGDWFESSNGFKFRYYGKRQDGKLHFREHRFQDKGSPLELIDQEVINIGFNSLRED